MGNVKVLPNLQGPQDLTIFNGSIFITADDVNDNQREFYNLWSIKATFDSKV